MMLNERKKSLKLYDVMKGQFWAMRVEVACLLCVSEWWGVSGWEVGRCPRGIRYHTYQYIGYCM